MVKRSKPSLGKMLLAWREGRGLSQSEAATLVGVDQGVWSKWETDVHAPMTRYLTKLEAVSDGALALAALVEAATRVERKTKAA